MIKILLVPLIYLRPDIAYDDDKDTVRVCGRQEEYDEHKAINNQVTRGVDRIPLTCVETAP